MTLDPWPQPTQACLSRWQLGDKLSRARLCGSGMHALGTPPSRRESLVSVVWFPLSLYALAGPASCVTVNTGNAFIPPCRDTRTPGPLTGVHAWYLRNLYDPRALFPSTPTRHSPLDPKTTEENSTPAGMTRTIAPARTLCPERTRAHAFNLRPSPRAANPRLSASRGPTRPGQRLSIPT